MGERGRWRSRELDVRGSGTYDGLEGAMVVIFVCPLPASLVLYVCNYISRDSESATSYRKTEILNALSRKRRERINKQMRRL